jgi:hypothetical protein
MELAAGDYMYVGFPAASGLVDASWIHRRKESVLPCSDTWVRRQTSIDFTLPLQNPSPPESYPTAPLLQDGFLVPITLLPKVPPALIRFDVHAGSAPLPLPTRRQNALASYAALLSTAGDALHEDGPPDGELLAEELRCALMYVALAEPDEAKPLARSLVEGGQLDLPEGVRKLLHRAERDLHVWSCQLAGCQPQDDDDDLSDSWANESFASSDDLTVVRETLAKHPSFRRLLWLFARSSVVLIQVARLPAAP